MIGYTLAELRRLLNSLVQARSPDPDGIWSWSGWRRRRQYQARLCHYRLPLPAPRLRACLSPRNCAGSSNLVGQPQLVISVRLPARRETVTAVIVGLCGSLIGGGRDEERKERSDRSDEERPGGAMTPIHLPAGPGGPTVPEARPWAGHATVLSRSAGTSGRSSAMKWPESGIWAYSASGSCRLLACRSEGRDQSFSP